MMNKKLLVLLAIGTFIGFGGAGLLIIYFYLDVSIGDFLEGNKPLYVQVITGLGFGFISAKAAWAIVDQPFLKTVKEMFFNIFRPMDLNKSEIIFISVCAGVGEEILFRGAVQPMLGVWTTALLFVFLHGYISPFNLSLSVYGIYMTLVIGVMGLMTIRLGIVTAMTAHFVIDLVLLIKLTEKSHEETDTGEDIISS